MNVAPEAPRLWVRFWEAPFHLRSELNLREATWAVRHRRAQDHRGNTLALCRSHFGNTPPVLPARVTILRRGKNRLDDDNLAGAAKHCRDGVADWLGVKDDDPRVRWVVLQEHAAKPSVRVEVQACTSIDTKVFAAWWLACELQLVAEDARQRWVRTLALKSGTLRGTDVEALRLDVLHTEATMLCARIVAARPELPPP